MRTAAPPATRVSTSGSWFTAGDQPLCVQGYSVPAAGTVDTEELGRIAGRGVTTLRVWSDYYETGDLDVDALRRIRRHCEELDLGVLLVLFSPAFLSDIYEDTSRFDHGLTMFNSVCDRPEEVVERQEALDAIAARCRSILEIFEDSPALIGWEVVNQTDDLYDVGQTAMADFVRRLADRVRREDRPFGGARLVTASSFQPVPPAWLLDLDDLDFAAFHPYSEWTHDPTDRVSGAVHLRGAITYALERMQRPRPLLDTESGTIAQLFDPASPRSPLDFREELAHNLRWAHLASGGAGTGLHIPVNDEGLSAPRRVSLSRLRWQPTSSELDDIDAIAKVWSLAPGAGTVRPLTIAATGGAGGVFPFASATGDRALGWLLRDTRAADLAADIDRALAAGPTVPANLDLRLQALDSWRAALRPRGLDPLSNYSRKALSLLLRRGKPRLPRACALLDEMLEHLLDATRRLTPDLLDTGTPAPASVTVRLTGLAAGPLLVRWIDDRTGEEIDTGEARGPAVELTSPPFDRHVALVLTPAAASEPAGGDRAGPQGREPG